jgi:hypothetical protein
MIRAVLNLALAGCSTLILLIGAAQLMRPSVNGSLAPRPESQLKAIAEQRNISFDNSRPDRLPRIQREKPLRFKRYLPSGRYLLYMNAQDRSQ